MSREPQGTYLLGIVCPKCNKTECEYEGNYYCTSCDFSLPDGKMTKSLRNWYALAYTSLMYQRGDKPDHKVVERIMREGY